MDKIEHIEVAEGTKVSELVKNMGKTGFGARKISEAGSIFDKMRNDSECRVFLGVAGAMVPAGMKKIIINLLNLDNFGAFVTTGANLTHDLIEDLGGKHYLGSEFSDDKKLNEEGIDRIHNVFMKNSVYEELEDFFSSHFDSLKECKNIKEFLWKLGELSPGDGILKTCYEKKIPIFCPGIADSGIGMMMWGRFIEKKEKTNMDVFSDMNDIIDLAWGAKKIGVIYICGGLPKNFIQQSLQFSKGADYGIQITTDRFEPGGSSGAPLNEGISWGKLKKDAKFVNVFCDATIALPLVFRSVDR